MSDDSGAVSIDPKLFWSRIESLVNEWKNNVGRTWGDVDSVLILTGSTDSDDLYSKLIAIQLFLFGYEIPDSAILITKRSVTILTSAKKANILRSLASSDVVPPSFKCRFIESNKADKNAANIQQLKEIIEETKSNKVGEIANKSGSTDRGLAASLLPTLKDAGLEFVDVTSGVGMCLAVADAHARDCLTKSGELTMRVLKRYLLNEVESIIDEEKSVSCLTLADQTDEIIRNPAKVGLKDMKPEDVESCYTPIIQSGTSAPFDLRPSAQSPQENLQYESGTSIILQLGARYRNYCSNIGRTYLINPTPAQKEVYRILTEVYIAAKAACKPGMKTNQVYDNARRVINQSSQPHLLEKFVKNIGFGIGLEFRDSHLMLSEKNNRVIQKGMSINLCVGFSGLSITRPDGSTKSYAVYLSDTLLVNDQETEALTKMPREYKDITYLLGNDDGDAADGATQNGSNDVEQQIAAGRQTRHGEKKRTDAEDGAASEKVRAAHQAELARKQREIALKKLAAEQADSAFQSGLNVDANKFQAYTSTKQFPAQAKPHKIFVDVAAESLLLPIHDQLVPFHILTVKNVHKQEEGPFTSLRITFLTPDPKQPHPNPSLRYISELTYRTQSNSLDKVFFDIRELRKRVQNRMKEFEAKSSLVEQEELIVRRDPLILKDVLARPQLSRKKATGSLQAHANGLRYVTTDKAKVDIIYSNIRACFYQPAQDTHQVLLHFELKNAILIDKSKQTKKTNHLQVYYEVVDVSEDLGTMNRYRDEDGLMEEQQERIRRRRWNEKFLQFVKDLESRIAADNNIRNKLEFDIPYRELAFTGVPGKATVDVMPTVHSLVALDDQPPMVLMLAEVEIAVFERVQFGLKNFDLVFVFKDFSKPPARIDSIPVNFLEPIKHWLNSCDIVFYESQQNLLWKAVMKHINSDIEDFWRNGGWSFLSDEGGEGEGGGEGSDAEIVDEESEFEVESEEASSGEDDSEEYETASSEEGSDDYSSDGSDGSGDESGEDWDQLESKAAKDDMAKKQRAREKGERDFSDDDDDDRAARPVKKMKK